MSRLSLFELRKYKLSLRYFPASIAKWPASWQNQQNDCASSEDSDQPGHLPSLIRVFAVRMKKAWVLNYPLSTQRRLWSDWADAQADLSLHWADAQVDLSLRWAHSHFVGFVMRRFKCCCFVVIVVFCSFIHYLLFFFHCGKIQLYDFGVMAPYQQGGGVRY